MLCVVCLMNACATTHSPQIEYIKPPEQLLTPCIMLQKEIKTNQDLIDALLDAHESFDRCAAQVEALRTFFDSIDAN